MKILNTVIGERIYTNFKVCHILYIIAPAFEQYYHNSLGLGLQSIW